MTTWRDVERLHLAHPSWTDRDIATHLDCNSAYVRATAQRRGYRLPKIRGTASTHAYIAVPVDRLEKICRPNETPNECLWRIVHKALVRAKARAA